MSSKHLRSDVNYAYPTAEFMVMGADGAVAVINRKEIAQADDPDEVRKRLEPSTSERSPTRTRRRRSATSTP